ncbi:MAG: IS30 family transposase [Candidatus Absconditabacterales bacterium]
MTFIFSVPIMKHLSITERDQIQILLSRGCTHREIALTLGRHHKSINEEIKNNSVKGKYIAKKAHHKAYVRRLFCKKAFKKIRVNDELEQFVRKKMKEDWTPEEISGDWDNVHKDLTISTPTIYKYIYSRFGYGLTDHLYTKRIRPKKMRHKTKRQNIKFRTFINFRPKIIASKREFGHYECDLIMGSKASPCCLLVLIEMKTRFKIVHLLPSKGADYVEELLHKYIKKYSIKSITFDNGSEFANHFKLGIPTYFCHAHSPREKPQVERGNRNIRRYFPKGTDFSKVTQEQIDFALQKLNHRPMKCLKYQTPSNMFKKLLSQVAVLTL